MNLIRIWNDIWDEISGWQIRKVQPPPPPTPAEVIVNKVKILLYPPFKVNKMTDDGKKVTVLIDTSIDSNLDAALADLQDGKNDEISQRTILSSIKRLEKVRSLLHIENEIKGADYIKIENPEEDILAEDIVAAK